MTRAMHQVQKMASNLQDVMGLGGTGSRHCVHVDRQLRRLRRVAPRNRLIHTLFTPLMDPAIFPPPPP